MLARRILAQPSPEGSGGRAAQGGADRPGPLSVGDAGGQGRGTHGHSQRVARIARRLGEQLVCRPVSSATSTWPARLHDIGKVGIHEDMPNSEHKLLRPARNTRSMRWRAMSNMIRTRHLAALASLSALCSPAFAQELHVLVGAQYTPSLREKTYSYSIEYLENFNAYVYGTFTWSTRGMSRTIIVTATAPSYGCDCPARRAASPCRQASVPTAITTRPLSRPSASPMRTAGECSAASRHSGTSAIPGRWNCATTTPTRPPA